MANLHKATPSGHAGSGRRYHGRIPMGIGTGSPASMPAVLRNTGLDSYFPVVVTADDVELLQ